MRIERAFTNTRRCCRFATHQLHLRHAQEATQLQAALESAHQALERAAAQEAVARDAAEAAAAEAAAALVRGGELQAALDAEREASSRAAADAAAAHAQELT